MRTLIGMHYSPWTEKAKWALEHHRLNYHYADHLLIFGMPMLRARLGVWLGEVTVPALIDIGPRPAKLMDSWNIARHADLIGEGSKLFPLEQVDEIERFNKMSEAALDAGRAFVTEGVRNDPEAQADALPPFVPAVLRKPLRAIASVGLKYLDLEFGMSRKSLADHESTLRKTLLDLRAALNGRDHLLGETFTYADIAMATALHAINPPAEGYIRMKPSMRRCWNHEGLKTEFADLLEWRNRIYARYRPARLKALA